MTRTGIAAIIALAAALPLAGCVEGQNPNETSGTLLGGALGGLIGSSFGGGAGQLAATGAGVLIGAVAGSSAGASMDRANRLAQATPAATPLPWRTPGATGMVTEPPPLAPGAPTVAPLPASRNECREFQQTITIAGQTQQAYGTACRQPDGTWRIVR